MLRAAFAVGLAGLLLTACAQTPDTSNPKSTPFMIGTGGSTGVYYVVGQATCKLYQKKASAAEPDCTAPASSGSAANLRALAAGDIDYAIVRSDWAQASVSPSDQLTHAAAIGDLRAIASFYPEPLNILVRRGAGISTLDDLPKARLAISRNSSAAALFALVMRAEGWTEETFVSLQKVDSTQATIDALCSGEVDAIPMAVGHPSGNTKRITSDCAAVSLQISGPEIEDAIAGDPALSLAKIPASMYAGQEPAIATFGPRPLLVTRANAPDAQVRLIAEAIFSELDRFKKLHPAFAALSPQEMVSASLPIPLHPAAEAYYRELGLLN